MTARAARRLRLMAQVSEGAIEAQPLLKFDFEVQPAPPPSPPGPVSSPGIKELIVRWLEEKL
jgi:hypothetical protein